MNGSPVGRSTSRRRFTANRREIISDAIETAEMSDLTMAVKRWRYPSPTRAHCD